MNEIIDRLKGKLAALRDSDDFKYLSEKEWIILQISKIAENLGHNDLRCIEKNDYFKKTIQQCIGYEKIAEQFEPQGITCLDEKGQMVIFYVFTPRDGDIRTVYSLSDEKGVSLTNQDEINEMLRRGLRPLSKTRREEYLRVLSEPNDGGLVNLTPGKKNLTPGKMNLAPGNSPSMLKDLRKLGVTGEPIGKVFGGLGDHISGRKGKGGDWHDDR